MKFSPFGIFVAAILFVVPTNADSPFNGKSLDGWKAHHPGKGKWVVGSATLDEKNPAKLVVSETGSELINAQPGSDLLTEAKYGDCTVELEFMIPKGSNSGVYMMGEYEVQIYDTYDKMGKDPKPGDMAGIYTFSAPKVFATKKFGEWQKFVIDFQAPKFEGEKKVANAKFLKVTFNDMVIHENVECNKVTPGGLTGKEMAEGPLMFQGDHGSVAFRNLKITPRK